MERYVVAVRRSRRGAGANAFDACRVPGVKILGSANPERVLVEASPLAAEEVKRRFGNDVVVEPEILHDQL